ncbi:MAG: membrane dipeptidase [Caldilineaceae bacterium]
MNNPSSSLEARIDRLHQPGLIDMHFDMLMDLYEKRHRQGVLEQNYLPDFQAGGIGVVGAAIYIEEKYLPEMALRVALDQISCLYAEVDRSPHFAICRSYAEIVAARQAGKIALLITMEGVEPLGADLHMLRVFYELGVRAIGLTHARRNMAADGGIFAPTGSSKQGLTSFGKEVVRQCEALGILLDLAHLNPAGTDDLLSITQKSVIISHSTPRHYYDIERNSSDAHIRAVGQRGGVIGMNAVLVSPDAQGAHLDRYVDEIEYAVELAGADGVGLGFDFFEFIYRQWSEQQKAELEAYLTKPHFLPDLSTHAHARNLTRKLIERGFDDEQIAKVLYGNWLRVFASILK